MKNYFLSFDYYNRDINKFYSGIIKADLTKTNLQDVAGQIIEDNHHDIKRVDVIIKIVSFNDIETD